MTDGHEVSLTPTRDEYERRILVEVEAGRGESQRSLARSAGIALGLTNLVLKRLVRKGWVRITRVKPNRVRYLITPAGIVEKARMSRAYFAYTTRFYAEARDRIRERFQLLSAAWPEHLTDASGAKRIVFYGASEVAEIGYVCLQETDLCVTDVVTSNGETRFFGLRVHPVAWIADARRQQEFGMVVVMAFGERERVQAWNDLSACSFPPDRVFWM